MNKIISITLIMCMAFSANAQTAVKAGDIVPVNGVLLTNEEAAKILAEEEYRKKICKINSDIQLELAETKCKYEKSNLQISLDLQKEKEEEILRLKDTEAEELYAKVGTTGDGVMWFAGGLVVGILTVTAASATIFFVANK